ncbi:Uncharacterized protein PHSC3_000094 [Chlamydiales bacterium STE3]|nr:Uncharacterized protein PHSC3_000094 [Chlamydiales bacterium STE3]
MLEFLIAPSAVYGQMIFVKLLGVCFFFAFFSLSQQILGLYGSQGILPIDDYMHVARQKIKAHRFGTLPTLFWFKSSDKMIKTCVDAGIIFSLLVILGVFPAFFLTLLCILYLSFISVGNEFLSYQWDALLIETGFLGVLYAIQSPPPIMVVYAARFLLFRFIFSSGIVKLLSGCLEWRSLNAMKYHFETQPLPNRGGYYLHQIASRLTKILTLSVYFLELIVPFFIFGGSFLRLFAAASLSLFQLLLMATGSFAFFNLLTIALCFTLVGDKFLLWMPQWTMQALSPNPFLTLVLNLLATLLIVLNVHMFLRLFFRFEEVDRVFRWIYPFHLVNSYGLFAVMTTKRNEIILEGSEDGIVWKPYEFYWKPGALDQAPKHVAPLHPRLDWQMWFASLDHYQRVPWFHQLLVRILQDSKDVLALFQSVLPDF